MRVCLRDPGVGGSDGGADKEEEEEEREGEAEGLITVSLAAVLVSE